MRTIWIFCAITIAGCGGSQPAASWSELEAAQPVVACGDPLPQVELTPPSTATPTLVLCRDEATSDVLKAWRPNVDLKLVELRNIVYADPNAFSVEIRASESCPDVVGRGCFGSDGAVFCDEAFVARTLLTAAAYCAHIVLEAIKRANETHGQAQSQEELLLSEIDIDRFGAMEATALIVAQSAADHERSARMAIQLHRLAQIYGDQAALSVMNEALGGADGVRELDLDPIAGVQGLDGDMTVVFGSLWFLYRSSTIYVLSFIIGHELMHAQGGCVLPESAEVERSALLYRLAGYQGGTGFGCPSPPTASELNADRCGMRALKQAAAFLEGEGADPAFVALDNVGRRLGIELLADLLLVGTQRDADRSYRPEVHAGRLSYWPVLTRNEGYLNAVTRLVLFAQELRSGAQANTSRHVAICGQAAERLLEGFMREHMGCVPSAGLGETWRSCLDPLRLPVSAGVGEFLWTQQHGDFGCAEGVPP